MYRVSTFYCFRPIAAPGAEQDVIERRAVDAGVIGSILVAAEGVNGTVAADPEALGSFVDWLVDRYEIPSANVKYSGSDEAPFRKLTVRHKAEIVSLGLPEVDPTSRVGTYVEPRAWDELISRDDLLLIDCRNDYEIEVGTFRGAVDPGTEHFREFVAWAEALDPDQVGPVAMFCTGGIRCEKASSLLLERGFREVYHLHGGILRYLEERGEASQTWDGECFVFDRRVTVDRRLKPGTYDLCWACRMPISGDDRESERFEEGVSCPKCWDQFTDEERASKRERHRQFTESATDV